MSEKITLPLAIVIAGLLIGGGIYYNGKVNDRAVQPSSTSNHLTEQNSLNALRPIDANDHILGSSDARVIVVEYSDPECPFCKIFHSTMLSIIQEYGVGEKVAWVYRHYPIAELHSRAFKEAEAQECAGALGGESKFWEYTNRLYEITPSNNQLEPDQLVAIAVDVGLESVDFKTCLASGEFAPRVNLDLVNAQEMNLSGTPSSILIDTKTGDHYPIEGAYPYATLKQAIDLILGS